MKASPEDQKHLLELQAIDTTRSQLNYRRENLPEIKDIEAAHSALESARQEHAELSGRVQALGKRITVAERQIDEVRARIERDQSRMESGVVPAKDLESMAHEIRTLKARQNTLEVQELELLEEQESLDVSAKKTLAAEENATKALEELEQRRDSSFQEIDGELAEQGKQRESFVSGLPSDLVATYEKVRANRGYGAALLRGRRCEGCRIDLSGTDLAAARAAAPDDVVRCEECRCVLVRTEESGL